MIRNAVRHTVVAVAMTLIAAVTAHAQTSLLNVSYDPTRELYRAFNDAFAKYWQAKSADRKSRFANRTPAPALRLVRSSTASKRTS